MFSPMRELLWDNPFRKWFMVCLILIDFLGSLYGYYWYRYQLAENPVYLWLFIPDSPLSTTLTGLALFLLLLGKDWPLLQLIAYTAVIKYGLWAVVLISHFGLMGGQVTAEMWMLWFSHWGMAAEGFIFLRHLRFKTWQWWVTAAWMLFNDWVDYGGGLHPYLYAPDQWRVALIAAVALSVILLTAVAINKEFYLKK